MKTFGWELKRNLLSLWYKAMDHLHTGRHGAPQFPIFCAAAVLLLSALKLRVQVWVWTMMVRMIIFDGFCRVVESMLSTDYFYGHKLSVINKEALRKPQFYRSILISVKCFFHIQKKYHFRVCCFQWGKNDVEQMD